MKYSKSTQPLFLSPQSYLFFSPLFSQSAKGFFLKFQFLLKAHRYTARYICLYWFITVCTSNILIACNDEPNVPKDAIRIGALLPFSGEKAAIGLNIEQALSLAIKDINDAGGVNGHPIVLISRDSNSGSDMGLQEGLKLLYDEKIKYLIGPEDNELAKKLVPYVKDRNVLHILPAVTAPTIKETGIRGAWIRLAPSPNEIGCAMAFEAIASGHLTASALVSADDYQTILATSFNSHFEELGGKTVGTINISPSESSYIEQINILSDLKADVTILLTHPTTGALITLDWVISTRQGSWYLGPTLYTDVFLQNIPFGALEGFKVFSPSLVPQSQCIIEDVGNPNVAVCLRSGLSAFTQHYSNYWGQDHPLPGSRFYYDAVILLAFGLERAAALQIPEPLPSEIRDCIRYVSEKPGVSVSWSQIKNGLSRIGAGEDLAYTGAAAEYKFRLNRLNANYGEAIQRIIDVWSVKHNKYIYSESIASYCKGSEVN